MKLQDEQALCIPFQPMGTGHGSTWPTFYVHDIGTDGVLGARFDRVGLVEQPMLEAYDRPCLRLDQHLLRPCPQMNVQSIGWK